MKKNWLKSLLSRLKWSLNTFWNWKAWTFSFQMRCRTHFFEFWSQRSILLNAKSPERTFWYQRIRNFSNLLATICLRKSLKDLSDHLNVFFSGRIKHTLSFLFLQLPELIWWLRNVPISKQSPKNVRIHEWPHMALADGMIYEWWTGANGDAPTPRIYRWWTSERGRPHPPILLFIIVIWKVKKKKEKWTLKFEKPLFFCFSKKFYQIWISWRFRSCAHVWLVFSNL